MPCYKPIAAERTNSGAIRFNPSFSKQTGNTLWIPCGRCIGCRLEYSRTWAVRIMHETEFHQHNQFVTLTYDADHLPSPPSLNKRDMQLFFKRLRKGGHSIRYYCCGEYGDLSRRPHYHAIIFGLQLDDLNYLSKNESGMKNYSSETLQKYWPHGFVTVGESVTFESAAYVARYVTKKITGDIADEHYRYIDESTGEIHQLLPEFAIMSRRHGIGALHPQHFAKDYDKGFITMRGKKMRYPRFYESRLNELTVDQHKADAAVLGAKKDFSELRLQSGEIIAKSKLNLFSRGNFE